MSTSTVRRILYEAGLYGRIGVRKPLLRKQNNVKRLLRSTVHKDLTIEQWNKVFWPGESKFEIFKLNRRIYVWRRVDERAAILCITPTLNSGGGSVMVRGAFANCKVWDLLEVKGKLNQTGYHCILQHHTIPSKTQLVGQRFILMQDNIPKHTSKLCQRYIKSKEEQNVFQVMSWSAQSADLNPIELVWDELDRKVRAKQPTSATHIWQLLQKSWAELPPVIRGKNAEEL